MVRIDVMVPRSTKATDLNKKFKLKNNNKENKENEISKQDRIKTSYYENSKLQTSLSKNKFINNSMRY